MPESNAPFNPPRFVFTPETQAHVDGILNRSPTRGLPNHVNPGAVPSLANFFQIASDWTRAYNGLTILNKTNEVLYEESKKLKCNKPFDYVIDFGKYPPRLIGIAPKGKNILKSADTESFPTTIIGTNCPPIYISEREREELKRLFGTLRDRNKKGAGK